jgi:hypothetical protein
VPTPIDALRDALKEIADESGVYPRYQYRLTIDFIADDDGDIFVLGQAVQPIPAPGTDRQAAPAPAKPRRESRRLGPHPVHRTRRR